MVIIGHASVAPVGIETALAAVAAFLLSTVATGVVRRFALAHGVVDIPNERSSHDAPTPRGGGIAIVLATTLSFAALTVLTALRLELFLALFGGGMAVAIVGILDDRYRLTAGIRLAVHVAAAIWALTWLGGFPSVRIAGEVVTLGWAGHFLAVAGIVWSLNLFNFMDGIDGIAAAEATFVACGGAVLTFMAGASSGVPAAGLVVAAASLGFLLWNWPPAKIFMGDVGSGYLGYVVAVLSLASANENPGALFLWLILGAAFFIDATVTLLRRLLRRERVYSAHRTHAYQWLARRWGSHLSVTVTFALVNLAWLLPLAWLSMVRPTLGIWAVVIAWVPLVVLALIAGAGRNELRSVTHDTPRRD